MIPPDDSPLWDMLARWQEMRSGGRDVAAEELCRDHPELLGELEAAIRALEGTGWLERPVNAGPDEPPSRISLPASFGEYVLLEQIGEGGMGRVYKALHRRMDRIVAVKMLPEASVGLPEALARFQDEIRSAARLAHPNVVAAYDAGEHDGQPFLVMEFVHGTDLARHVERHGPMAVDQAVAIILQAARALEYAHRQGVIHRDVKPSNLLLTPEGTVKLLDLGLARLPTSAHGPVAGTVEYMAPEQAEGGHAADERADVYALGCTLYFLLTGRPVYDGDTIIEKLLAHLEGQVPSLRAARPEVPEWLDAVFRRMVARNPDDRYPKMTDVVRALEATRRTHWPGLWVGVLLASAALAVLAFVWWPRTPGPETPTGTLSLEIEPADAVVEIDGEEAATQSRLPVGSHRVLVRSPGFEPFEQDVVVKANETTAVRVRLVPDCPGEWVPLFNGKDLQGWRTLAGPPGDEWQVEDGLLSGKRTHTRLFSERGDYADFRFRIEARVSEKGISGQGFRVKLGPTSTRFTDGYYVQAQSDFMAAHRTGSLFRTNDNSGAGGICRMVDEMLVSPGEWYEQEVIAIGSRIVVRVNGRQVVDHDDPAFARGHFTLHSGDTYGPSIEYRKVEVKEYPRR